MDQFFIVLIDDILIYSQDVVRHAEHLKIVLQTQWEAKLFMKFNKCDFWLNQVMLLGHIISFDGLKVDS